MLGHESTAVVAWGHPETRNDKSHGRTEAPGEDDICSTVLDNRPCVKGSANAALHDIYIVFCHDFGFWAAHPGPGLRTIRRGMSGC